jgi:hypothetical protein
VPESGEKHCIENILRLQKSPGSEIRQLEETLALGLLVTVKWDRAKGEKPDGVTPDAVALAAKDTFTAGELKAFRESARVTLEQHVARVALEKVVIDAARRIAADAASRKQWWGGVWQNVFASFVWAFMVLGIGAIAVKANGGDFAELWNSIRQQKAEARPTPPAPR